MKEFKAITVDYAEIGEDGVPKSFGLADNLSVGYAGPIYNSVIERGIGPNGGWALIQGYEESDVIGSNAIVTVTAPKPMTFLNEFTKGDFNWIHWCVPEKANPSVDAGTTYIFCDENGMYSFQYEDPDSCLPQTKGLGQSVQVTSESELGPYKNIGFSTKADAVEVVGAENIVLKAAGQEIVDLPSYFTVSLENANNDNYTDETLGANEESYSVNDYIYNIDSVTWTYGDQDPNAQFNGPYSSLIEQTDDASSENGKAQKIYRFKKEAGEHEYKMASGHNRIFIRRNKGDFTVPVSIGDEYKGYIFYQHPESEENTLLVEGVKYGQTVTFSDCIKSLNAGLAFDPETFIYKPGVNTLDHVSVNVVNTVVTDTIKFTGWLPDGQFVSNQEFYFTHSYPLPASGETKEIPINASGLTSVDITQDKDYFKHMGGASFTRKYLTERKKVAGLTGLLKKLLSGKDYVDVEAESNWTQQTVAVMAHYSSVPYVHGVSLGNEAKRNMVASHGGKMYAHSDFASGIIACCPDLNGKLNILDSDYDVTPMVIGWKPAYDQTAACVSPLGASFEVNVQFGVDEIDHPYIISPKVGDKLTIQGVSFIVTNAEISSWSSSNNGYGGSGGSSISGIFNVILWTGLAADYSQYFKNYSDTSFTLNKILKSEEVRTRIFQ